MIFFAYLFAGLGELLIGRILDVHHDASQVFLIVAAASGASAAVALLIRR